ncbi:ATP-binding cassette domain-containing protein [Dysgonomonas sp. OttesenSCG-928-M03]|nr:ATP-binding cassette domain-containing protein [Dysgonomonas sp. OttesenSCG-928-M03]
MSITVQNLTYMHPDKEILFQDISFSIENGLKAGLVGNNGSGKSTLLQIISKKDVLPSNGEIICHETPYYIPQHFGQYNDLNVAQALHINEKLTALHAILEGDASEINFATLNDDWNIEERSNVALASWGLDYIDLFQKFENLSGGEKTRVFLAGIDIHNPQIILMDEPTNHLDYNSRNTLYETINSSRSTMLIVSHDRTLLNQMPSIYELTQNEIVYYAGNYDFYKAEKEQYLNSLQEKLEDKEKELRLARKIARETAERKEKHESRGKKNNIKKGVGKMAMDTLQDKAEKSRAKLNDVHTDKLNSISQDLSKLRSSLSDQKSMKIDFNTSDLHTGKILVTAQDVDYSYDSRYLWNEPLSFQIKSGERVLIKGKNGSGKTTLIKLITEALQPSKGTVDKAEYKYVFLDQEYTMINNNLTVLEQVQLFNSGLLDHEIRTILNRFLFTYDTWDKSCSKLSGGEKMKLALCCLMVGANTPDMFILDEPTNNIDVQNIEILTATIRDYKGTVLLVSHDEYFINQVGIDYTIELS